MKVKGKMKERLRSQVPTSMRRNQHHVPSSILFFRIIHKTSLQRGHLKMTKTFTGIYGGGLPNPVFLKPPDGTEWKVYWTKHDDRIWFEKGWKDFATHYSLGHRHFVLFKYNESSHFKVRVFDKSKLEIEYPFYGSPDENLDEPPPCKKTRQNSPMSSPQPRMKLRSSTRGDVGTSSNLPNMSKHVNQSEETNFEKSTFASVEKQVDENKGGGGTECLEVEEELTSKTAEALNRATTFQSKITNPSFMVVMKPSYVNTHYLCVTSQFARKYLKKKQGDILPLVLDGKTWPVNYSKGKFNGGWKKFASDNHLNVGDVCLFELTNCQEFSLKTSIFRVLEESHYSPSQDSTQVDKVNGKEIDHGRILNAKSKGGKATQKVSLLISPGSFLNEALQQANKFTSENPFFTFNIKAHEKWDNRPYIPRAFVREHLTTKKRVKLQYGKNLWSVELRRNASRLSRGWALLANESKLVDGDVCVFELINREDAVFHVHIFRGCC